MRIMSYCINKIHNYFQEWVPVMNIRAPIQLPQVFPQNLMEEYIAHIFKEILRVNLEFLTKFLSLILL